MLDIFLLFLNKFLNKVINSIQNCWSLQEEIRLKVVLSYIYGDRVDIIGREVLHSCCSSLTDKRNIYRVWTEQQHYNS